MFTLDQRRKLILYSARGASAKAEKGNDEKKPARQPNQETAPFGKNSKYLHRLKKLSRGDRRHKEV
jgi:hypothetical protein